MKSKQNLFFMSTFIILLLVSFLWLKSISSVEANDPKVLLAGNVPLFCYFCILLFNNSKLDKNLIDTVYYFGFLITITTLGLAAFSFNPENADASSITLLLQHFGAGLVATGFALVARLFLISIHHEHNHADMVKLMEETNQQLDNFRVRASAMFSQIEIASKQISEVSTRSIENINSAHELSSEKLGAIHQKSLEVISGSLRSSMGEVFSDLKTSSEDATKSLVTFTSNLDATNKNASFKKIPKSFEGLGESISSLNEKMDDLNDKIEEANSQLLTSNKVLREHSVEAEKTLSLVSSTNNLNSNEVYKIKNSMEGLINKLNSHEVEINSSILNTKVELNAFKDNLRDASETAKATNLEFKSLAAKLSEIIDKLKEKFKDK